MLVMNKTGAEKLLTSKFSLGLDWSVANAPVERTSSADTDPKMTAEILSYSRLRGAFTGVALHGATPRPDKVANIDPYGSKITNTQIVNGSKTRANVAGSELTAAPNKCSLRKE
jgi:lipid-binding SYLF domain-containing protein